MYNGTEWNVVSAHKANGTQGAGTFTSLTATTANATTANVTTLNAAGAVNLTDVGGIAAAGSVIANATAIANTVSVVSGADDAKGVVLPASVAGKVYLVYSSQATNGLKLYPPVNSAINGGSVNAAVVIEGKSLAICVCTNSTNWGVIFTLNT